ncbi:hypothetical protein ACTWP5_10525 [Streptomyces sp. 4N509B]|uniref:hypothetical protein n=1 Tax=Streptomyces sp. 4N509B TaxID=3457413 RepID=UPI003FD5928C
MRARDDRTGPAVDEMVRRVLSSAKYRELDPDFVRRVVEEALARNRDRSQALKYAKRKLHQAFGAFLTGQPARSVEAVARQVASGELELRDACLAAMRSHASSAERLPTLEPFYEQVARWCGAPASVVDLACGLNPLAVPWMRLAPGGAYWCCDVDESIVSALRGLDAVLPVRLTGATCDLVASPPSLRADVAFLLKTLTTVEQQRTGAAHGILAALDCAHVVVSLPRRSLSGRREYTDDARAVLARAVEGTRYRVADEAQLGDELLCHLVSADAGGPPGEGGA